MIFLCYDDKKFARNMLRSEIVSKEYFLPGKYVIEVHRKRIGNASHDILML